MTYTYAFNISNAIPSKSAFQVAHIGKAGTYIAIVMLYLVSYTNEWPILP